MTKTELIEDFDRIVTDERVSLKRLNAHLESVSTGSYLLDRNRRAAQAQRRSREAKTVRPVRQRGLPSNRAIDARSHPDLITIEPDYRAGRSSVGLHS